jgi:hypothetical protein
MEKNLFIRGTNVLFCVWDYKRIDIQTLVVRTKHDKRCRKGFRYAATEIRCRHINVGILTKHTF